MKAETISFICLAAVFSALAVAPAHAGPSVVPIKTLNGLKLVPISGTIGTNCTMNTPELCKSRKDISISPETSTFMKQTLEQMAPGQERYARNQAQVKEITEENQRLKGSGQELKIAKNIERLVELQSEVHSEYQPLQFTPFLWAPQAIMFGESKYRDSETSWENTDNLHEGPITMGHVLNHNLEYERPRSLKILDATYTIKRYVTYSYNPNMEMSFVVRVQSYIGYPNQSPGLYATEDLVARCEEIRIRNTVFKITTTLSERHLVCKLPENLGHLRFKVIEKL